MKIPLLTLIICTSFLAGCASTNGVFLTEQEANLPKQKMLEKYQKAKAEAQNEPQERLWNQPENKAQACLLPVAKGMTDQPNFRQYWDGGCKNGYAYGLGRDIVISDMFHYEEIIYHDFDREGPYGPLIWRDVINKITARGFRLKSYWDEVSYNVREELVENRSGEASTTYTKVFENYPEDINYWMQWNTAYPGNVIKAAHQKGIQYWHHFWNVPAGMLATTDLWYINETPFNPNPIPGVPYRHRQSNGQIDTLVHANGAPQLVHIIGTGDHWTELDHVFAEAEKELTTANMYISKAEQLEKAYLHKLRQKTNRVPAGLDPDQYYAILDYYTDFNEKEKATLLKLAKQRQKQEEQRLEQQRKNAVIQAQINEAAARALAAQSRALNDTLRTINENRIKTTNCYRFGDMVNCTTF